MTWVSILAIILSLTSLAMSLATWQIDRQTREIYKRMEEADGS